jgi:hypothetical protein
MNSWTYLPIRYFLYVASRLVHRVGTLLTRNYSPLFAPTSQAMRRVYASNASVYQAISFSAVKRSR